MTALIIAAKNNEKDCVTLLLDHEKNMKDNNGHNARWHATDECKELLAKEEECTCSKDLFEAAENGCDKCCRKYINQAGKTKTHKIKNTEYKGVTALMLAATNGYTKCVELLAEKEARMQDSNGWTALMFAAKSGHLDTVKALADREIRLRNNG